MGRVSNYDRKANDLKIMSMWLGETLEGEFGWINFRRIRKEMAKYGFDRNLINRYLERLVEEGKMKERKDGERTRLFRPIKKYWDTTFLWIPISPDADDAEYLYFVDLASSISTVFKQARSQAVSVQLKNQNKAAYGLSRNNLNELNDKIATLVRYIRLDLSKEYFKETREPDAVYALLRGNVKRLVDAYTDLWLFITQTYGARQEYAKQMLSVQRRVAKLKREH
jgi:hypothetical protein